MGNSKRTDSRVFRQPSGLPVNARIRELTYLGRSHVGFDISRGLAAAEKAGHITREIDVRIREQLIWLRTKHDELSVIAGRVRHEWVKVRDQAVAANPADDAYTLNMGRTESVMFSVDIESFVTLLYAAVDTLVALVTMVERLVLKPPLRTAEHELRTLPGVSADEQELFSLARNGFAHQQAGWLAVVLLPNGGADLAILTRWRPDYQKGEGYVLLSQVDRWAQALERHIDQNEALLAKRLTELK